MDVLTKQQLDTALTLGSAWIQSHAAITITKSEVVPLLRMCGLTDSQMALIDKTLANHTVSTDAIVKKDGMTTGQKEIELWKIRKSTYDTIHAGLQSDQQQAMDLIFNGAINNYEAVRNKLPTDLKPKFDAFVRAIFTFAESKITLK
jgi:ribosomal protein S13